MLFSQVTARPLRFIPATSFWRCGLPASAFRGGPQTVHRGWNARRFGDAGRKSADGRFQIGCWPSRRLRPSRKDRRFIEPVEPHCRGAKVVSFAAAPCRTGLGNLARMGGLRRTQSWRIGLHNSEPPGKTDGSDAMVNYLRSTVTRSILPVNAKGALAWYVSATVAPRSMLMSNVSVAENRTGATFSIGPSPAG